MKKLFLSIFCSFLFSEPAFAVDWQWQNYFLGRRFQNIPEVPAMEKPAQPLSPILENGTHLLWEKREPMADKQILIRRGYRIEAHQKYAEHEEQKAENSAAGKAFLIGGGIAGIIVLFINFGGSPVNKPAGCMGDLLGAALAGIFAGLVSSLAAGAWAGSRAKREALQRAQTHPEFEEQTIEKPEEKP